MLRLLAVLLTELKLFGVPLRTPILAFFPNSRFSVVGALFLLAAGAIYLGLFLERTVLFQKSDALLFAIISIGAVYFGVFLRFSIDAKTLRSIIRIVFLLFTLLSLSQAFSLLPPLNSLVEFLFQLQGYSFGSRASGFSAEPSFFVWISAYFILLAQLCGRRERVFCWMIWAIVTYTSQSITALFLPIAYGFISLLFSFRVGNLRLSVVVGLVAVLAVLFIADRIVYLLNDYGLGWFTYINLGSWRELSTFSGIYGSSLISSPSGGELWGVRMFEGQTTQAPSVYTAASWLQSPWSLAAMWSLEFGFLATTLLILLIAKNQSSITFVNVARKRRCSVLVAACFFGLILAPKWCVFFFLIPNIVATSSGEVGT